MSTREELQKNFNKDLASIAESQSELKKHNNWNENIY